MGKGDRRSKRGKIFRGTYGKKRPKPQEERKKAKAAAAAPPVVVEKRPVALISTDVKSDCTTRIAIAVARSRTFD